jgi:carboxymethylenebutenolidase
MLSGNKQAAISEKPVAYFQTVNGFYAAPQAPGTYPGVVMIHEWWGLNDQIKDMARTLAREGYQVIAVDLYNGSVAKTPEEARTLSSQLNQDVAVKNLQAAVSYLRAQKAPKIASLGWCFGGGQSLQLSVSGIPLAATVVYYGTPITDTAKLKRITWPVLGIFGEKDTSIPPAKVNDFQTALDSVHIKNSLTVYPGVGHAFANPTGQSYAPRETKDAWSKTLTFLQENLKKSTP